MKDSKQKYEDLTVSEIKDIFREENISGYSSMNKEELIEKLEEEIEEERVSPVDFEDLMDVIIPKEEEEKEQKEDIENESSYEILNITSGVFVLKDLHGNGVRIPIPEKHKDAKIGDIIKL